MKLRVLVLLFSLSSILTAQQDEQFPVLVEGEPAGAKIERTEYYNGNSLWGLINGGADIYLEYGFDKLAFQSVDWKNVKFRVEIYRMQSDKGAFGIFSINRYKCDINDTLTKFICITPYQVQAAIGKFYISIANDSGNETAMRLTIDLFQIMLAKMDERILEIPQLFSNDYLRPFQDKIKFIVGELGLQNGFPMWYDMFAEYSDYEFFVIPFENGGNSSYISQITFADESGATRFAAENSVDDNVIIKSISSKELIFVKTGGKKEYLIELLQL